MMRLFGALLVAVGSFFCLMVYGLGTLAGAPGPGITREVRPEIVAGIGLGLLPVAPGFWLLFGMPRDRPD